MEPVPETERMEEFRASSVPTLRIQAVANDQTDEESPWGLKPPNLRRSTEPTPSSPRSPGWSSPVLPYRPRNTSPLLRGHVRSRSTASALSAPMSRAQSMPGVNAAGHLYVSSPKRPSSPAGSPHRNRTPRKPVDDVFPVLAPRTPVELSQTVSAISEDDETPEPVERSSSPTLGLMPGGNTFPRSRRPASPLRNLSIQYSAPGAITPTTPTSVSSSPSFPTTKINDSFITYGYPGSYTSSSVPSTPNSVRSRSPSISSLETIPDSPDAEEAALEAERIAQLKAAADAADGDEAAEAKRRGSLDVVGTRGRSLTAYGTRDKRKRWSVCGAERRGDLDLETIWED